MKNYNDNSLVHVAALTEDLEKRYNETDFIHGRYHNARLEFSTEEEAIQYLNTHIKFENIDPNYIRIHNDSYYK